MKRVVRLFFVVAGVASALSACSSKNEQVVAGPATESDGGADSSVGMSNSCSSARKQLMTPIDKTSTGDVSIVSDENGEKTIYIDASAGGQNKAASNPRVYVDLATGTAVDVTDVSSTESTGWDLALKRYVIYTNGGDGGPGQGAAQRSTKSFNSITAADATELAVEKFFDEECNPLTDRTNAVQTTFTDWYEYDQSTDLPTPLDHAYIVRGGTGTLYRVKIVSYSALPDGGTGPATAFYLLKVAAL